mgnify:CR=1 FL=1
MRNISNQFRTCFLGIIFASSSLNQFVFSMPLEELSRKCRAIDLNQSVKLVFNNLSQSKLVNVKSINCDSINLINQIDPVNLLVTTGRRKGESVVCISETKKIPCRFVIASFKENIDPSKSLKTIFDIPEDNQEILNETTSRVFINPNKLVNSEGRFGSKKIKKKIKLN